MEPELKYLLKGASSPGALSQQPNNGLPWPTGYRDKGASRKHEANPSEP